MKRSKKLLCLVTFLLVAFTAYTLLSQHSPTVLLRRNTFQWPAGKTKVDDSLLGHAGQTRGKRTLRQLLQDTEITQLPVRIITDCHDDHPLKTTNEFKSESEYKLSQDPNTVCLNESKLYINSYAQYGEPFESLSILQQKASIVRAVLDDLETRNQFEMKAKLGKLVDPAKEEQESEVNDLFRDNHPPSLKGLRLVYFPQGRPLPNETHTIVTSAQAHKGHKVQQYNEELLKFKGERVNHNYDLAERGFSSDWRVNSTTVKNRLKVITMAINETLPSDRSVIATSTNPNLLERAKFQHEQLELFCRQKPQPPSTFPLENTDLDTLFQHLLYDDTRRIVFCYVPKNACSNMKRMMLVLNGLLPPEASKQRRPDESLLKQVHSFRNLSYAEAKYRLTHYFKFAIVRNPLERLLSAYKNKLEGPFIASLRNHFPERLKAYILKRFRNVEFSKWISRNNASEEIHPSFSEFVQFMNVFPLNLYNEHFKPFLDLCNPCALNFDLFLSFKTLEYDVFALMEYFDIPFGLYPESLARHVEPMSALLEQYYAQVPDGEKTQLFRRFSRELEFYYSIHPEEWGTHFHL